MKEYGESPEGNMPLSSTEVPAHGYPYLPWLSKNLIARVVRNLDDAQRLAMDGVTRKPDTLLSFEFAVASQNQRKKYVVRLSETCMPPLSKSESGTPRNQVEQDTRCAWLVSWMTHPFNLCKGSSSAMRERWSKDNVEVAGRWACGRCGRSWSSACSPRLDKTIGPE